MSSACTRTGCKEADQQHRPFAPAELPHIPGDGGAGCRWAQLSAPSKQFADGAYTARTVLDLTDDHGGAHASLGEHLPQEAGLAAAPGLHMAVQAVERDVGARAGKDARAHAPAPGLKIVREVLWLPLPRAEPI